MTPGLIGSHAHLMEIGYNKLKLDMMYVKTYDELVEKWYDKGPMIDSTDHMLTVRSVKLNCDSALGARGAWLLEDYADRPGHRGHGTLPTEGVSEVSEKHYRAYLREDMKETSISIFIVDNLFV